MGPEPFILLEDHLLGQIMAKNRTKPVTVWEKAIDELMLRVEQHIETVSLPTIGELTLSAGTRKQDLLINQMLDVQSEVSWTPLASLDSHIEMHGRPVRIKVLSHPGWFVEGCDNPLIEPNCETTLWFWGQVPGMRLVTVQVRVSFPRVARIHVEISDVRALVQHPGLYLDYQKIWDGLARFFDLLVKQREVEVENARYDRCNLRMETKLLQTLFSNTI